MTLPFDEINFRHRVASSVVLIPLVLFAIYRGGLVYDAVVILFMLLGLREWLRMVAPDIKLGANLAVFGTLLAVLVCGVVVSVAAGIVVLGVLTALLLGGLMLLSGRKGAGWIAFGLPYIAGSGLALIDVRAIPDAGLALTVYLMAVVWGTDIGAYVAGRLIGGPKLLPAVSPKKTWAGLFGGMAFAALLGYAVAAGFGDTSFGVIVGLALLLAVVSQAGDLFESYVKRRYGVKDSGNLIPGHGGVLDRIDGLMFAAVLLAVIGHKVALIGGL